MDYGLRRRVLAEWRGLPGGSERPDRCVLAADVLGKLLPRLGLDERIDEVQIQEAWREIVGDFLAAHSIPTGLNRGTLTVQVLQSTVRYDLERNWKKVVLSKMRERFGERIVKDVVFRL